MRGKTYVTMQGNVLDIFREQRSNIAGSNPGGDEIFLPSRPVLGSTQPTVQWIPGISRG